MTLRICVDCHPGSMSLGIDFTNEFCAMHRQPATFEPNPTAVYMTQVATELAREEESYILKAFEKVGINPNVVIEQDALISKLKAQINAVAELHCRDINEGENHCRECYSEYPCKTIQAIEEQIK